MKTSSLKQLIEWLRWKNRVPASCGGNEYLLSDEDIRDDVLIEVTALLQKNRTLKEFNLSGNNNWISLDVWRSLIKAALYHPLIMKISFTNNALITVQHMHVLVEVLQMNDFTMKELFLYNNTDIPFEGFISLFESLQHNPTLEYLTICCCSSSSTPTACSESDKNRFGRSVQQFLQQTKVLKVLYMNQNYWGASIGTELAIGLQSNTSLTELGYWSEGLPSTGTIAIANALQYNTTLTHLNLSCNEIDNEGAIVLAESLRHPKSSLQILYLYNNFITDLGFTALANAIKYNTSLRYLNCCWNRQCSELDTVALIDVLQYNTTLETLRIDQRNTTLEEGELIIRNKVSTALEYNDTIHELSCSWPLTDLQKLLLKYNSLSKQQTSKKGGRRKKLQYTTSYYSRSGRIAPKKGGRVRTDIYNWLLLLNNWSGYDFL